MEIFTSFPLLILYIIIWFVCLILALFDDDNTERAYVFMGISIAFIILIIGYSNVAITGLEFHNATNTTILTPTRYVPHIKTATAFSGIFIVQVVLLIWLILRNSLQIFYRKGKY